MSLNMASDHINSNIMALIDYNYLLEKDSLVSRLNEKLIEQKVSELEEIGSTCRQIYWITLARLDELSLLCAGNYADNFEFVAAGDLLVNPRLMAVHMRNQVEPFIKERHSSLIEQFNYIARTRKGIIQWLKSETWIEIKKKPLWPYLYERLKSSGYISQEYLDSADRRMRQIADVIGFLSSWHLPDSHDFHQHLKHATPSEREFIKSKLCRFDKITFFELGYDLHQLIQHKEYKSKFLR